MSAQKIPVSADALLSVLKALIGPAHLIRELQATSNISNITGESHPIDVLIEDYQNAAAADKTGSPT